MKNVFFGEKGEGGSEKKDKETFLLSFPLPKSNIKSPFSHFGISYIDICNTDM